MLILAVEASMVGLLHCTRYCTMCRLHTAHKTIESCIVHCIGNLQHVSGIELVSLDINALYCIGSPRSALGWVGADDAAGQGTGVLGRK